MSGIASGLDSFFSTTYDEILKLLTWPAIIAFAIAFASWIFSSNPQTVEKGKSWALRIAIGLGFAYLAKPIINALIKAFKDIKITT